MDDIKVSQRRILKRIRNGVYTLNEVKGKSAVYLSKTAKMVGEILDAEGYDYYISGVDVVVKFMQHVPEEYPIMLFVEKNTETDVTRLLKENEFFGGSNQYLQLSSIHVSKESRGEGIGRQLLLEACERAKEMGAKKLYISAHSSEETMAFYTEMGCVEAKEYNETLVAREPYDCQLELFLES